MTRFARAALWLSLVVAAPRLLAGQERGAAALGQLVDGLGMTARVLVVAAHPDDEDTRLIAWLAKGRHAETAYLSLTRGDGGQNLVGNELGEALGAIRTEELLAARRIDGGEQYFGRAFDFGFSKSAGDTERHWPHDSLLGDVVRVVRAYRPHVLIAIWSGTPADGHGHHQLSGILAREAYDASADTVRYPAAAFGPPWAVPKFYRSRTYRGNEGATLRYNAGAYDPLLGRSYAEIAAESRSQHKSQGQGGLERKGASIVSLSREATRVNAAVPAMEERDLFDGVDTTLARLRPALGCEAARSALDSLAVDLRTAQARLDLRHPEEIVPALAAARRHLARAVDPRRQGDGGPGDACALRDGDAAAVLGAGPGDEPGGEPGAEQLADDRGADRRAGTLRARLDSALILAAGVALEAEAARELVAVGDTVGYTLTLHDRGALPVRVLASSAGSAPALVPPDSAFVASAVYRGRAVTRLDWLTRPRDGDVFTVPVGTAPAAYPAIVARALVEVGGVAVPVRARLVYRFADPVRGDVRRPLAVVPAVSVMLDHALEYVRAGVPVVRVVPVHLRSASTRGRRVVVRLELPAGLVADAPARTVSLAGHDARAELAFTVRGTVAPGRHQLRVVAEGDGERFAEGYELVDYEHIRPLRLYRPSTVALQGVDVALPARARIAYVQGVGDNVAPMLAQLGLPVTLLDPAAIGTADLSRFTAVVVGQRAYDASDALVAANARLLEWVKGGGTLVVQGGQYEMMRPGVMPYPVTVPRPVQRVTHADAPVTLVEPAAGVLSTPNRIGAADFADWVQERARYIPAPFDPAYQAPLSMHDPGDPPSRGTLLVARYGTGTYVYTTLSFFRQLPAGNPGAARLFVNLLAARAPATAR